MLTKKLKKAWVKALRSGDFKQAVSDLGTKRTGNCCLGVLCYVAGAPGEAGNGRVFLDREFAKKLGITQSVQNWCADMNDARDYNFEKIAGKIENSKRI